MYFEDQRKRYFDPVSNSKVLSKIGQRLFAMIHQRCRLKSLIDADEAVEDAYELICPIGGNSFLVGGSCSSAGLLGQARTSCEAFASERSRCTEC